VDLRRRLLIGTDRILAAVLATVLLVAPLAFGGAVWWARPAIAGLTLLFVLGWLGHVLLEGRMRLLKSPLTALGVLALGLAAVQLAPLPAALARRISPRAQAVYTRGYFPDRVLAADPTLALPEPALARSPLTLDRAATVRWLAGAAVCLALFWGVAQFTDRLERLYLVWGSIVAAFYLNTSIALVQLVSRSGGVYGFLQPGEGPSWAPSVNDLLNAPNTAVLRAVGESGAVHPTWAALVPDRPFQVGTMLGGSGAYLALGALGLPLALALTLQQLAPRGSRAGLSTRLRESGQGSLVFLLLVLLIASAVLVGMLAGPWFGLPFVMGLAVVGFSGAWSSGLRWTGRSLTVLVLVALGGGMGAGALWAQATGVTPPVMPENFGSAATVWADALPMVRDYPWLGTGLGSFASIFPYYKSQDQTPTTALSSLLQWWIESGAVGLALLTLALLWCLIRLPGAVRRVGTADRSLVFGLIGTAVSFTLYSVVHWTVELTAVAVVASAWGGTLNRWLAGGTDLFVERG
jgi:O-Antigen ligase